MPSSTRERLLLAALVLALLVPFLGKAFSIDVPVFLAVSRQILASPLDPFGFDMIWDSSSPHAYFFNRNPPLLSYYLAPWIRLFGESELALHLAALPFALTAAFAFAGIARRLSGDGLAPAALLVASPAFVVLGTTLLLDVPVLAFQLLAVHAFLRSTDASAGGDVPANAGRLELAAGLATAAAGLTKYVGLSTLPLIAAGFVLLTPRRAASALRLLGVPCAIWALWGLYTHHLYGAVHFLGSTDVIFGRSTDPDEVLNQLVSGPIYLGAALLFPCWCWLRALCGRARATELAVLAVVVAAAVVASLLPQGEPPRRVPLGLDEGLIAALGFAGGSYLWSVCLDPSRLRASGTQVFLALWLVGTVTFTLFVNWHVNAADALLAAPPALLMLFRDPGLRPSRRLAALWVGAAVPLSLALAWADATQANAYRSSARRIAAEIGDQPGARWFVGHWGLQYYLEREGFHAVAPPTYGRSQLAVGDWIATARNVSQLDITSTLNDYTIRPVWRWELESWLPLRTTNADAGAGFYSHHSGYVPFGWSDAPVETLALGRVTALGRGARPAGPQ